MPDEVANLLDQRFNTTFASDRNTFVATVNLIPLMQQYCAPSIHTKAETLRDIEAKARNAAAHRIIAYEDSDIRKALGKSSMEIVDMLHDLFCKITTVDYLRGNAYWDSCADMNRYIASLLQQSSVT